MAQAEKGQVTAQGQTKKGPSRHKEGNRRVVTALTGQERTEVEFVVIWLIWIAAIVVVAATVIPAFRTAHGLVRSFSFGRQQIIVFATVVAVVAAIWMLWVPLALTVAALGWQIAYIARFFPTGRVQSLPADAGLRAQTSRHLRIMTANVKLSNREHGRLADLVRARAPQILVLMETDADWLAGLSGLHDLFPHRADRPLDTGYGMSLWSDRPFQALEWRELLVTGVPSIRATVEVDGESVALYILHPEPPVPFHDTMGRDAEIGLVGMEAARDPLPAIVTGDLNDVAWSHTTRRFQRLSGQLDPRVGRGFYNTFHAHWPIMRWPLDHLFHDPRFRLVGMERLPPFGSDHFAMLFVLALAARDAAGDAPAPARPSDRAEILQMKAEEQARDRPAIGEDWEKG